MLTAEGLKSLVNTNINQLTELYLSKLAIKRSQQHRKSGS